MVDICVSFPENYPYSVLPPSHPASSGFKDVQKTYTFDINVAFAARLRKEGVLEEVIILKMPPPPPPLYEIFFMDSSFCVIFKENIQTKI